MADRTVAMAPAGLQPEMILKSLRTFGPVDGCQCQGWHVRVADLLLNQNIFF